MGCDIHAIIEVKTHIFNDDYFSWKVADEPYISRNYSLFTFLAGVRDTGEIEPISEPKGIPRNEYGEYKVSSLTTAYLKVWKANGHSHSWLSLAEMKSAGRRIPVSLFYLADPYYKLVYRMVAIQAFNNIESDEDIRLVFFFDN